MKKLCPAHKDTNPSLHIYETYAHCFTCGYRCPVSELGLSEEEKSIRACPTNISEEMEYIDGLSKIEVRGLSLPADDSGYYIIWSSGEFYKKRLWEGKSRYIGPRGHRPPLFVLPGNGSNKVLFLVEGELNALSLFQAIHPKVNTNTIASPGSAVELPKALDFCLRFDSIAVIVDKDIPGVAWGLKLKQDLLKHKKRVELVAIEKDINQILQDEGDVGVRSWFESLDVSKWM